MSWRCFECGSSFPPEGFNANATSQHEIQQLCIAPGHWRRCVSCANGKSEDSDTTQMCASCNMPRFTSAFDGHSAVCRSCVACTPGLEVLECTVCSKRKLSNDFTGVLSVLRKASMRRCDTCRTCARCNVFHSDAKNNAMDFATMLLVLCSWPAAPVRSLFTQSAAIIFSACSAREDTSKPACAL